MTNFVNGTVLTAEQLNDAFGAARFKDFHFTPLSSSPTVFTSNDPTSIVTSTTLSSTNSGSPTLPSLGNAFYSMMTCQFKSGSIDIVPPIDDFYASIIFHDGTITEENVEDVFTNPTNPAVGAIVNVLIVGGVGQEQLLIGGVPVSGTLPSPTAPTTITSNSTQIITAIGTGALNTTLFGYCSVVMFNPAAPTAPIPTLTYANSLSGLATTPIPNDAIDGDALIIEGLATDTTKFTLLGSQVMNGDYCVLLENKTALRVIHDSETAIQDSLDNGLLQIIAQNENYTLVPDNNNLIAPSKPTIDTTIMSTQNGTPVGGNYVNTFTYVIPAGFKKGRITVINQTRSKVDPLFISDFMIGGGILLSSGIYSGKYLLSGVGLVGIEVAPFTSRTFDIISTGSVMSIVGLSAVSCSLSIPSNTTSSCIQATPSTNNVPMAVGASVLSFKSLFDRTKARSGMRLRLTAADGTSLPVNIFNDGVADTNVQDYFLTDADITNGYAIVTANPTAVSANLTNTSHSQSLSIDSVLAYQQPASSINYNSGKGLDDYTASDFVTYAVNVS